MNPVAIRTDGLTRDFGTVRAVDHLAITVSSSEIFGFLGPNGSGKTTTIRLLLGLLEPTQGRAEVLGFGTQAEADRIRERCGALLENSGLYERLSAQDNLEFYARVWRLPMPERKARIQELLTHIGLWDRRAELVGTWSRGMKQKLAVARALLHRPELLFLDEPTAGLDPVAAAALREDLASLVEREGLTVFLTTHNLAEAEKLCHQVGVINQGKLLAVGPLDRLRAGAGAPRLEISGKGFTPEVLARLRAAPDVHDVELRDGHLVIRTDGPAQSAPLVRLLVNLGAEVEEVHKNQASLEDIFLTLVKEETEAKA